MVLIGYKKCCPKNDTNKRVIGVFEIPEDALFCPKKDNFNARYRVNKCKLVRVENLIGNDLPDVNEIETVSFTDYDPILTFKINEVTECENFADNQNLVDLGILMFLTVHRARFYLVESLENGTLISWRSDGTISSSESFMNWRRHGPTILYHPNGKIKEEINYAYGYITGIQSFFDTNGCLIGEINHSKCIQVYSSYTRYT